MESKFLYLHQQDSKLRVIVANRQAPSRPSYLNNTAWDIEVYETDLKDWLSKSKAYDVFPGEEEKFSNYAYSIVQKRTPEFLKLLETDYILLPNEVVKINRGVTPGGMIKEYAFFNQQEEMKTEIVELTDNYIRVVSNYVPEWASKLEELRKEIIAKLDSSVQPEEKKTEEKKISGHLFLNEVVFLLRVNQPKSCPDWVEGKSDCGSMSCLSCRTQRCIDAIEQSEEKDLVYYPFKSEIEWLNYNNNIYDVVCDKILNYTGAGKFSGEKIQKIADIVLQLKQAEKDLWPSDEEIRNNAKDLYPFDTDFTKDDILYFKQLRRARIYGAKWMIDLLKQKYNLVKKPQ